MTFRAARRDSGRLRGITISALKPKPPGSRLGRLALTFRAGARGNDARSSSAGYCSDAFLQKDQNEQEQPGQQDPELEQPEQEQREQEHGRNTFSLDGRVLDATGNVKKHEQNIQMRLTSL